MANNPNIPNQADPVVNPNLKIRQSWFTFLQQLSTAVASIGVKSLNGLTGAINLVAGTNITLVSDPTANTIKINAVVPPPIPGPPGQDGVSGFTIPGLDGSDGQDGIPGPPGPPGPAGATGPPGPSGSGGGATIPGLDGEPGEDGLPGPPGATGATGAPGTPGAAGSPGQQGPPGYDGLDGEDYSVPFSFPAVLPASGVISTNKSSSFTTTSAFNCYFLDTSGGAWTVTLNATPALNEVVEVWDSTGDAGANPISFNGNGNTIAGSATLANFIAINFGHSRLIFDGSQWLAQ